MFGYEVNARKYLTLSYCIREENQIQAAIFSIIHQKSQSSGEILIHEKIIKVLSPREELPKGVYVPPEIQNEMRDQEFIRKSHYHHVIMSHDLSYDLDFIFWLHKVCLNINTPSNGYAPNIKDIKLTSPDHFSYSNMKEISYYLKENDNVIVLGLKRVAMLSIISSYKKKKKINY